MALPDVPLRSMMMPHGVMSWAVFFTAVVALYVASRLIYNVFFHPLNSFPGPLSHRASILPRLSYLMKGRLPFHVADLHARYGPVVRIAPNELAFADTQAWRDIYTRKPRGNYELEKDQVFYNATGRDPPTILSAGREKHDSVRKLLSSGFSERSMRAQEPVINGYVDKLIWRLSEEAAPEGNLSNGSSEKDTHVPAKYVNMTDWLAFTLFDVIGMLSFGSDFGCLQNSEYHPWVKAVVGNLKDLARMQQIKGIGAMPVFSFIIRNFGIGISKRREFYKHTIAKTRERVTMGTERYDFLDSLILSGMDFDELKQNAGLIVIAGSETTATLLTGALFFLTTHPEVLERLTAEVRGRFKTEDEITLTNTNGLTYMLAVLDETLRCYPPFAVAAPRVTPVGGAEISGHFVPGGATVGVWHWAMYHSSTFFTEPYRFAPDRFLQQKDSVYANDRTDVMHPFSLGPRNCIGRNLAYMEMRLILARLVWRFDMTISDESRNWMDSQMIYTLWMKPALKIKFTPAVK